VFGAAVLCSTAIGFAQDRPGSVYVIAGVAQPRQSGPTGEQYKTYVVAPGGTTWGWLVGGGIFVARTVSIEAEWSGTGVMASREPSRYGMTFDEERQDRFLSFAVRFSFRSRARVRIEPVIGLVATYPKAWSQTEYYMHWQTPEQVLVKEPRLEHHLDTTVGPLFGCDVRLGSRHVALVPSFRISDTGVSHGVYSDTAPPREIAAIYPGGYPKWTIRSSLGVRVDF
jgi:hypothetical protein